LLEKASEIGRQLVYILKTENSRVRVVLRSTGLQMEDLVIDKSDVQHLFLNPLTGSVRWTEDHDAAAPLQNPTPCGASCDVSFPGSRRSIDDRKPNTTVIPLPPVGKPINGCRLPRV